MTTVNDSLWKNHELRQKHRNYENLIRLAPVVHDEEPSKEKCIQTYRKVISTIWEKAPPGSK